MKRYVLCFLIIGLLISLPTSAQLLKLSSLSDDAPIYQPFETVTLIDNHTTMNPYKGSMNIEIQHRFAPISTISDLFGIYGSANTRMAVDYGITDNIMLGFGTTRKDKLQDLEWKVSLLQQTESGKMPVSVSYVGNAVLNATDKANFGPEDEYSFAHRLSYMNQLLISRKFGEKIGVQVAPTMVWMNAVQEGYNNTNFSVYGGIRAQVLGFHSIIFEYEQPINKPAEADVYPNLSLGAEIGTSTHSFRIFVSNYNSLVKNYDVVYNSSNPFAGDYHFGFNISIRF